MYFLFSCWDAINQTEISITKIVLRYQLLLMYQLSNIKIFLWHKTDFKNKINSTVYSVFKKRNEGNLMYFNDLKQTVCMPETNVCFMLGAVWFYNNWVTFQKYVIFLKKCNIKQIIYLPTYILHMKDDS